jgi:hypothetical protein
MRKYSIKTIFLTAVIAGFVSGLSAQSTSQDFPTPVTSNEISGTIKARDLGDSRLTAYYYAVNGDQGDLFINLVSRNFTGDIDVFTVSGMRPMAKIVVYADYGEAETGRAIYLRKPEKLLLRVQGRTPNDDEATFRIKFAGSFAATRPEDVPAAPDTPKVSSENRSGIRVNSVGTILPPPPKPAEPVEERAKTDTEAVAKTEKTEEPKPAEPDKTTDQEEARSRPELVVTDPVKPEDEPKSAPRRTTSSRRRAPSRTKPAKSEPEKPAAETVAETDKIAEEKPAEETPRPAKKEPSFRTLTNNRRPPAPKKPAEPDPLESINLVIQFKDGTTLEKRMSEVFKFSVDKGVLTVILKDKSVTRYPIIEVARVTIE